MSDFCSLCPPARGIVAEDAFWNLVLNDNQATLGRMYFALKRHETDVTALSADEALALWEFARRAKRALESLFAPDHFNYLFHMNLTPHVHMHVYPRYKTPRLFAGQTFTDTHFGDHYDPHEAHGINEMTYETLAGALRAAMSAPGGGQ